MEAECNNVITQVQSVPKHGLISSCYYLKLTFILGDKERENAPSSGKFEWRHKAYTTQLWKNDLKISFFRFHLLRRITLTLDEWRRELNFPPSVNSSTVWLEDVNRAGDLRPTVKCEGMSFKDSESEGACLTLTFKTAGAECSLSPAFWKELEAEGRESWLSPVSLCMNILGPLPWFTLHFVLPHYSYFPLVFCPEELFLNVIFLSLPLVLTMQKSNKKHQNAALQDGMDNRDFCLGMTICW